MVYILLFVAMSLGYFLLRGSDWESGSPIQPMMEWIAGLLSLTVGVIGMVRFYDLLTTAEQANASAREDSRIKSMFLANTSHEIRNPMYIITGMAGLALKTDLDTEQQEYLKAIQISAEALLRVLNDILDFSKMEAGRLELDLSRFNPGDVLILVVKGLAMRAQEKGLTLSYEIDRRVPGNLVGDAGRLRQVITNLVNNSIEFTEKGQVALHVETDHLSDDEVVLHFAVTDTGSGIPAGEQQLIFEPFTQADSSMNRVHAGTGLGLTIAKQLVEMMGGRLWVESQEGRGSTFHFTARFGVDSRPDTMEASPATTTAPLGR